jgi:HAD superfamily hydrolase (TIGR01509 family)
MNAVVFDLDGVLVDSEPVWEEVRRAFVAEHGGRWQAGTQRRLMGMSTAEWAAYLAGELGVGLSADEVARRVIEQMERRYADRVPLMPGALDAVRRLAARWPLGLASSSPRALIDTVLDRTGLRASFGATVSTEEVARGKPAPDGYLLAARRLGADPVACAAVEDSSNGLRSAAAAGMRVIAVPHPRYPPAPDALALAAFVAADLDDLTVERVAAALPAGTRTSGPSGAGDGTPDMGG